MLHLVQRDIRYLGIEVGPGSHAPSPPALVYERRYGDCKDKALLMVTMLRALDIEAAPALVHTSNGVRVAEALAGPNAFNHVIVRATLGGRTYWLDPTRDPQAGTLEHLTQAGFGKALVIDARSAGLVDMGTKPLDRKRIEAVFDAPADPAQPVSYVIKTVLEGRAADRMRADLARKGRARVEADYLNYYARKYRNLTVAAPLAVQDDAEHNRVTTTETYAIAHLWQYNKEAQRHDGWFGTSEIASRFNQPRSLNRTAPLALDYPDEIDERTEVRLTGKWNVRPSALEVKDDAFEFAHTEAAGEGKATYVVTDHYRALKREIPASGVKAYAAHLEKADDAVGLSLYRSDFLPAAQKAKAGATAQDRARFALRWKSGLALLVTLGVLALACRLSRPGHRGANGWLLAHATWMSLVWWDLSTRAEHGWKGQSLAIVVAFIGTVCMVSLSPHAPDGHWLRAVTDKEALLRYGRPARALITAFAGLPSMALVIGTLYYVLHLIVS